MMGLCFSLVAQRPSSSYGQGGRRPAAGPSVTGKITGVLVDSVAGNFMAYATVSLLSGKEQKVVNGTLTDDNGRFKLQGVKNGSYVLRISSLGFKTVE